MTKQGPQKTLRIVLAAFFTVAMVGVGAATATHDHDLCNGFVPENDMQIPVGMNKKAWFRVQAPSGGLTIEQYNQVLDRIEKIYAPIIKSKGGNLKVNRKWTDGTVNASAQQFGSSWIINMYGGLARHTEITMDGFALVACHELGHHIGGAPKIQGWFGPEWATNEGGSDYFATLKCLRTYYAEDDNIALMENATVDPHAEQVCLSQFSDEVDQAMCMRNANAGASVAGLFMDLRKEKNRPSFSTPDAKEVAETDDAHPGTQCRLDTYFAGAICTAAQGTDVDNSDYKIGSCVAPDHTMGLRPRCWFLPN